MLVLRVGGEEPRIMLRVPIAFGRKLALVAIEPGEPAVKYGEVIGRATQAIAPGEHVHLVDLESMRGRGGPASSYRPL